MKPLSNDAMKSLDELLTAIEPIVSDLNRKVQDKSIKGLLDIQRIDRLTSAYTNFLNASNEK